MPDFISISTVTDLPPDLQWIDEYAAGSDLVGQEETYTLTGALVVQASARQSGRLITLQGRLEGDIGFAPLTRAQVDALRVLAAVPGAIYTLTLADGRTFPVMFRRENPAVRAEPLKHVEPAEPGDYYFCTINLIQV
ncbi:hypothetical protein [Tahibacter harae]|uniref:Uncharacterized protein n=1 Tax=Tahibacter harae TaxID=2963937 RepID=A0ABT1QS76_9GAMM|nr:hypothetical protein [Tahibacter harae]MCQ4165143.1 hypothetical protein [Tahibacter harae]